MRNIYGEQVNLTPAQQREYKYLLLHGPTTVSRVEKRRWRTYNCLKEKGLAKIAWAYGWGAKFERWM